MSKSSITTGGINRIRLFKTQNLTSAGTIAYSDLILDMDYTLSISESESSKLGEHSSGILGKSGFVLPVETTMENKETWEALIPFFEISDAPQEVTYVDNKKRSASSPNIVKIFAVVYGGVSDGKVATYHGTVNVTDYTNNGISGGTIVQPTYTLTSFENNAGALTLDASVWTSDGTTAIIDGTDNALPTALIADNAMQKTYFNYVG